MKRFRFLTLAALLVLPLAACDEGEDVVGTPVTGTVTGTVTIDGQGATGISVDLSNGQSTTTDASGRYTFSSVPAGAYTVEISGVPSDVTFSTLGKAATISSAGQVATVDFSGQSIRTSAILGSVTSGGQPLAGVTVTLSGAGTGSTTTDAGGQYSFGGLAAGSYTVAVSGLPAGVECAEASKAVDLGTGETMVVPFTCNAVGASSLSGILFVDGNTNNTFEAGVEDTLSAGDVTITLEGPAIGETQSTVTNADGSYSFTNLVAGTYNVCVDSDDGDIPSSVSYGGATECFTRTVGSGVAAPVNFPFDIEEQTVLVYAFLGEDGEDSAGTAPVEGVVIDLYPTEDDLNSNTNRLDRDTTNAGGEVQLTFDRDDDDSPSGDIDRIVFAEIVSTPTPFLVVNGETQIEILYDAGDMIDAASDTFDLLNTEVVFGFNALTTVTREPLEGWNGIVYLNDTTATAIETNQTDSTGFVTFRDAVAAASLPVTYYMRLSGAQPQTGGVQFTQDPEAEAGAAVGRFLRLIHDGLVPRTDTVDVGNEIVTFLTASLLVRAYHEADDTAFLTAGDNFENVDNLEISLYLDGDLVATKVPQTSDGAVTFTGLETNAGDYVVRARSVVPDQQIIFTDTSVAVQELNGSNPAVFECPLGADDQGTPESCATFAFKYINGGIVAHVNAKDGTPAEGLAVRIQAAPTNLTQMPADTTIRTDAGGDAVLANVWEGPYIVSLADSVTADGDTIWAIADGQNRSDTVDVEGNADVDVVQFIVVRGDTKIMGVVVNDRDADQNVIDVGEALAGVTLQLYRDNDGGTSVQDADSLIATTTTDANGAYTFDGLREGRYIVKALSTTEAVVLRGYEGDGSVVDTVTVGTTASANERGSTSPTPLPRWDYDDSIALNVAPSHFTFLFMNTEARGTVVDNNGDPVAGMTVTLRRCLTAPEDGTPGSATSPPTTATTQTCTTYFPNFPAQNEVTDANGEFSFQNLTEGIYEVDPQPATAAGFTSTSPASTLYLLVGSQDIESATFTAN